MPEFKRMTPAEIAASRKKIQELMGKKKEPAKPEPKRPLPETVEGIRNEMRACNSQLTYAINTGNELLKTQMMERMTALRNELHNKPR